MAKSYNFNINFGAFYNSSIIKRLTSYSKWKRFNIIIHKRWTNVVVRHTGFVTTMEVGDRDWIYRSWQWDEDGGLIISWWLYLKVVIVAVVGCDDCGYDWCDRADGVESVDTIKMEVLVLSCVVLCHGKNYVCWAMMTCMCGWRSGMVVVIVCESLTCGMPNYYLRWMRNVLEVVSKFNEADM